MWHLIAGPTGAGKTTYARRLTEELKAARFSIDEWMQSLFWMDCPEKNDMPWALERIARCETQIALLSRQLEAQRIDAILDLGFTVRAHREKWLAIAKSGNVQIKLHCLNVPQDERWRRVQERNFGVSDTYSFKVTKEMFEMMEVRWEEPTAEELSHYVR